MIQYVYLQRLVVCISGRTWFSSQGPSPVFTDSQVNGSRVTARLGDEVGRILIIYKLSEISFLKISINFGYYSKFGKQELGLGMRWGIRDDTLDQ